MKKGFLWLFMLLALGCSSSSNDKDTTASQDLDSMDVSTLPEVLDITEGLTEDITLPDEITTETVDDIAPDLDVMNLDTADMTDSTDVVIDMGPLPFSEGPYGTKPYQIADDFTLPTLDGDWNFKEHWSGGNDSYVFLFWANGNEYINQIWNSDPKYLFKNSPLNVHYFFLSYEDTAEADVEALRERVYASLDELGLGLDVHFKARTHFVTATAHQMGNWVSDVVMSTGYFSLAIDRFQRLRETGLLADVAGGGSGNIRYLRYAAEYFNYEWERERDLQQEDEEEAVTQVPVFTDDYFANEKFVDVEFPDAAAMAQFDTMEIDFRMGCDTEYDESCGEWDYLAHLHLCDPANTDQCPTEVGRWITAYSRPGHWVTDISSLLPLFQDGGIFRFKMNNSWQSYRNDMVFRLSNRGKDSKPAQLIPLWTQGGWFNLDYNPAHEPINVDIPAAAKRVEIVAYITGHGFAWDKANCSEFCNHQHRFTVGGDSYMKEFPYAGTNTGCAAEVGAGVVPNQFGTWPLGRGGWCPGLDVKPWVADITASVTPGSAATISYEGLYKGEPYDPVEADNNDGATPGNIVLTTYLAIWE